jgi:hypothetical protein
MLKRLRITWLAGGGSLLLVLSLSGVVAAATVLTALTAPVTDPKTAVVDPAPTFVDANGDGIDDSCQTAVEADPLAAASAVAAADLNGDKQISVSEAAQSGWTGGKNCNHGGYVSGVARGLDQGCTAATSNGSSTSDASSTPDESADPDESSSTGDNAGTGDETVSSAPVTTSDTTTCAPTDATDQTAPAVCVASTATSTATTLPADATVDTAPNAHGKLVSEIAKSTALGGKNCNHGGAVSEVAKDPAARDAAKAARDAAKEARAALREARKFNKVHGKGHGH